MNTFEALLLGLVQGLTEFLPVSSSGHLVLFGHALGIGVTAQSVLFDIVLHVATLAAVLVVYAKDLGRAIVAACKACLVFPRHKWAAFGIGAEPSDLSYTLADARLALFVVVATIPTGIIGVAFKDQLEALFAEPRSAAYALIATACILLSSRFAVQRQRPGAKLTVLDAIIVGTAQGIAIIPGISRSGTTITTGLWLGVDAQMAARASFIMSIPAILGALVLQLKDVPAESLEFGPMAVGAAAAFVSGIAAIVAVQRVLKWQGFWMFAPYCLLAAGVGLWMTA